MRRWPSTSPTTATAALERLGVHDYDVLILDRDLPLLHGDEVCRAVVDAGVAGPGADADRRRGRAGDGWRGCRWGPTTTCPSRSRSRSWWPGCTRSGRRARRADPPMLERAGVRLDWAHRQVFRDGRYVPLARKEFGVLAELLRAQGAVVSAEELLEKVWDEHIDPFTNTVRTTMTKLRKKLGDAAGHRDRAGSRGTASHERSVCVSPWPAPGWSLVLGGLLLTGVYFARAAEPRVPRRPDHPGFHHRGLPAELRPVRRPLRGRARPGAQVRAVYKRDTLSNAAHHRRAALVLAATGGAFGLGWRAAGWVLRPGQVGHRDRAAGRAEPRPDRADRLRGAERRAARS